MAELAAARAIMPAWMAEPVSALVADGRDAVPAAARAGRIQPDRVANRAIRAS